MIDLAEEMSRLPEPVTDKKPPYWEYWRWELWRLAQENPAESFLGWPCIYHTMCQGHWPNMVDWENREILKMSGRYPADISPLPNIHLHKSQQENNIRQLYHLTYWEGETGRRIRDLESIVEIGGGYGQMAMMAHRMGFRGQYVIYDLPEFSLLQMWFLEQAGLQYESIYPVTSITKVKSDLLIGIYSLSEIPMSERAEILSNYRADSYLFLYSGAWKDADNVEFFQKRFPLKVDLRHKEALHHNDKNNWYSVC